MLPQQAKAESARPEQAGSGKTILVVDDDSGVVKTLNRVLGTHGYHVFLAGTVEEAISALQGREMRVDLLLIDAVMPKMSGPELADILLFLEPEMKVLFITGLDSLAIRLAFERPCETLQKPFTARVLLSKVRETLGETPAASQEQASSPVKS